MTLEREDSMVVSRVKATAIATVVLFAQEEVTSLRSTQITFGYDAQFLEKLCVSLLDKPKFPTNLAYLDVAAILQGWERIS